MQTVSRLEPAPRPRIGHTVEYQPHAAADLQLTMRGGPNRRGDRRLLLQHALDGGGNMDPEGAHPLVDLGAKARKSAKLIASITIARTRSSTERVEMHCIQASWITALSAVLAPLWGFEEGREVATAPKLSDPLLDGPDPGLAVAIAFAVALHQALQAALAMLGAGHLAHIEVHPALCGKADHHPPQQARVPHRAMSARPSTRCQRAGRNW
jgi:hypothetical protein